MCSRKRGAVLSLPVKALREDTLAQGAFSEWLLKHIDHWFASVRQLGLGIEQMEELILVTGCDRTRSWTNVAFLGSQHNARVSFGVRVDGSGTNPNVNFQLSPEYVRGAVLSPGPEGKNLPENQCIFVRGFRVARTRWILLKRTRAAAGPSSDGEGYDYEPEKEVLSIPAPTKYRDPLQLLQDYITERAPDSDVVLVHDDDLKSIDGIGSGTSPETLQPDVVMDHLRKSNLEVHEVLCDLSPTSSNPNANTNIVKVAMLSTIFQTWSRLCIL
ncbi:hypothetical protein BJV74DRAFT_834960 [Russula compacta]|nr:hypothetical protein BJV74DRAFT_834960 [Russula compacta]